MSRKENLAWLEVGALVALRRNPQYLTPQQMDSLKSSIKRDGFVVPILVRPLRGKRYEVVSGNHRVLAAREIGMKEVPCVVISMDEISSRRLALNLNTIHGEPKAELVAPFLAELDEGTLREIHLEKELFTKVLEFDDELVEKLAQLQPVKAVDRDSLKNLPTCMCPTCGRRHQRKE